MLNRWPGWLAGLSTVGLIMGACSDDGEPGGDGGAGASAADTFGASECGQCVHDACAAVIAACGGDPECAAYVSCLDGCGLNADGNVDEACEQACPRGSGTTAQQAIDELTICRNTGPGASCSACVATGTGGGPGILNQSCPGSDDPNPCYECEDEHCCETYAAYEVVPEAVAYKECLLDCLNGGNQGCELQCFEQHPDGLTQWAPRHACLMVYCTTEDTCGEIPLSSCEICVNDHCAESFVALLADPAGYLLWACTADCADAACWDTCEATYPSAAPRLESFSACAINQCNAECG